MAIGPHRPTRTPHLPKRVQPGLAEELGLTPGAGFLRDPAWWALASFGALVAVCLWRIAPGGMASPARLGPVAWVSVVLWQPALEEIAFRGLLQGQLLKTPWGTRRWLEVSAANVIASGAFTGLHFLHHTPLWAAGVFAPSLVFGWLRERHRNVWSPMVMHALFNAEFFLASWLASS